MISVLIAPPDAPQIPVAQAPPPSPPHLDRLDHRLLAVVEESGVSPIWALLNWVSAEEGPPSRAEGRKLRLDLWHRLKRLLRMKLLWRHGRKSVGIGPSPPRLAPSRRPRRYRPAQRHGERLTVRQLAISGPSSTTIGLDPGAESFGQKTTDDAQASEIPVGPEPNVERQDSKSAPTSEEVAAAARALARLPRKPRRRWTGWLNDRQHGYRDMPVALPDGREGHLYGALRGKAIITPDKGRLLGGFGHGPFRWTVVPARDVMVVRNEAARLLGSLKAGRKERTSTLKAETARRNGRMPCRKGRKRGRPCRSATVSG